MDQMTFYGVQRAQQWEIAKGHLMAMLQSYYSGAYPDAKSQDQHKTDFREMRDRVNNFITDVEQHLV
jgi:hypothetical protein